MKIITMLLLALFVSTTSLQAATKSPSNLATNSPKKTAINLNTADVKALSKSMKGIGAKRAEAIIKYRDTHGKFNSLNDLSNVPGIGKKFVVSNFDTLQDIFVTQ